MSRMPVLSALLLLVLAGCAEKTPERFTEDKALYNYALGLFEKRDYAESVPYFESLKNRFPQSPYAVDSELKVADAQFRAGNWAEAEVSYQSFRSLHPTHAAVPRAVFQIGQCHFKRKPRGSGRDQSETEEALHSFEEVVSRWPESQEAKDAGSFAEKCRRILAERELYVVDYYLKRKQDSAAIGRLEGLEKRDLTPDLRAETLYKLGRAYLNTDRKDRAREVLSQAAAAPESGKFGSDARELLKHIP